jgi:hypothetical protein
MDMPSSQVIYYSAFEGATKLENENLRIKCIPF